MSVVAIRQRQRTYPERGQPADGAPYGALFWHDTPFRAR